MSRAPVKNTCPVIDKVLKGIQSAQQDIKRTIDAQELEVAHSEAKDAYDNLYRLDDLMEQLRSDNSALRDWGHDEAKKVDDLEQELEDLRSENEDLKAEIEKLQIKLERV